MNDKHEMRIASFARQIAILLWKNLIIMKCNLVGSFLELVSPILFVSFLLIIRHYIERVKFYNYVQPTNVYDLSFYLTNQSRNLVIYYPNSTLIRNLVTNAIGLVRTINPGYSPLIYGTNVSVGSELDPLTISRLSVFYSFPSSYENVLPNNIEYSIHTQEDSLFKYKIDSIFIDPIEYKYGKAPEDFCHDVTNFGLYNSFNAFKFAIDTQIISYLTGVKINNLNLLKTLQYLCPDYEKDEYHSTFAFFPPILVAVAFVFTTLFSVGDIVLEKASKMKEYLKLVGVKWYALWISWWIRNIVIFFVLSIFISIVCKIVLAPNSRNNPLFTHKSVLIHTEFIVILIFMIVYSLQACSFIILFSHFFTKPFDAKVTVLILWTITSINFYNYLPTSALKYFLAFIPNMGLQFGFQVIFQYERSARTLGLNELYVSLFDDPLNMGSVLTSMFVWTIIYLPLTWYMEKIFPGDYGVPLPYYFPFLKSYWFPQALISDKSNVYAYHCDNQSFEKDPMGLEKTVSIEGLSKTFKTFRNAKTVVKNISINFYENQITGLLGHNGAGKTTTTFMLCGLYPPTSGTAKILGYDLRTQMDKIRSILGYCPQVNILYDEFNVEEHLRLIAMIKGFPESKINDEIDRIATFVGLNRDLSKKSKNLSGGMKRRLMVAMALIGDSKIIILDEPTSGLDPFNRVKLWELIRKYKNGRTIILTTHFMEEADALSDRIAIMNHGEVRCYGTPLFLKNYYGNGFRVKIVKNAKFHNAEFELLVMKHLKEFNIETNVAAELCLSFPFDKVNKLPDFLNQLESEKDLVGIDSYSISSSTLEEVFLKVGKIDQKDDDNENFAEFMNVNEKAFNAFKEKSELKSGRDLWLQQIKSLLYKRLLVFRRRYILGAMILLLPIIFQLVLSLIIPPSSTITDDTAQAIRNLGSLKLDIRKYGSQELAYNLNEPTTGGVNSSYSISQLLTKFYNYQNRPKINLLNKQSNSVFDYVNEKHRNDVMSLLKENYFGFGWSVNQTSPFDVNKFEIVAYYSRMAYHTPAVMVNEISNLLLAYLSGNQLDKTISTYNVPLTPSYSKYYGNDFIKYLGCFDILPLSIFNFAVSLLLSLVISINVMHVSKENINESKKLQILSNTNQLVYWASNYIFDLGIFFINITSILIVILVVNSFKNDPETDIYLIASYPIFPNLVLVLFISMFSWPLYTYVWLNFFRSDVTSFAILLILLGIASFADVLFSFIQIFIFVTEPELEFDSASSLFMYSLRILLTILFPNVTIKRELFNFRVRSNKYCLDSLNSVIKTNLKYNATFFDFNEPGVGLFVLISFIQLIITILLLVGLETNSLNKEFIKNFFYRLTNKEVKFIKLNKTIESDVQCEIERVKVSNLKALARTEPLIVNQVVKLFKKRKTYFAAVDNLSFGVKSQRCFGLLGLNGAGKTTTFSMIIGEKEPDLGDVYINGYSIQGNLSLARQNLGYCPQFDRLVEFLTVEESLKMFARLRGIEPTLADKISKDMLDIFQLQEFKQTFVQNLSGGNKRKVSCAIAFIGKPSVVILDEPSTGMDPGARKFLWNIIKKARDLGITIVLSSHSMEECEALCDKLGIMLNGQMQCFGTIPELKRKYGDGYRLIIKCNHSDNLEKVIFNLDTFIKNNFPTAFLEDKQYETLFYIIKSIDDDENGDNGTSNTQNLSRMFSLIETHKEFLNIESYYISQTTLEQLFMSFANKSVNMENPLNDYFAKKAKNKYLESLFFNTNVNNTSSSSSSSSVARGNDNNTNTNTNGDDSNKKKSKIVLLSFKNNNKPDQYYF